MHNLLNHFTAFFRSGLKLLDQRLWPVAGEFTAVHYLALLFCALSPKNPLGGNATVPLTHIRLQVEYFIASLVRNLIPPISTLNHKTFNLTSVLLYFVHFLLFFLFTLLITQLFCWVFSNEKCICRPIVKRLNGQSVTLHSTITVAPQSVNVTFRMISIVVKIETRKNFINFIE